MTKFYKNVLITGAGKGIGESTVKLFISKGYFVYALIKDKKDNVKFKNFKNISVINGNVQNIKLIKKIITNSNKNNKVITCLVNNAGIRQRKKFLNIKKDDLENVFQTNFFSIFQLMQLFSKNLLKKKLPGSIVNISSIVGQNGFDELSSYGSSKGALISLTKCFAVEMAKKNIRANSVSPGFTKTSFYKSFKKNKKKLYSWTLSRIPQRRWGKSEEISELIYFLISDNSQYITGENINIDGGWLGA
jgi:3-oxoacyl-[acyl-carrier protein] reductase